VCVSSSEKKEVLVAHCCWWWSLAGEKGEKGGVAVVVFGRRERRKRRCCSCARKACGKGRRDSKVTKLWQRIKELNVFLVNWWNYSLERRMMSRLLVKRLIWFKNWS